MTEHRDAEFIDFVADHGGQLLRTAFLVTGDAHLGEDDLATREHAQRSRGNGTWPRCRPEDDR